MSEEQSNGKVTTESLREGIDDLVENAPLDEYNLAIHLGIEVPNLFSGHEAKDVVPLCRPLMVGEGMYPNDSVRLALARMTFRFGFQNILHFYGEDIRTLAEPASNEMNELVIGIINYFTMMLQDPMPELRKIAVKNLTHLARICSLEEIGISVAGEIADVLKAISLNGQEEEGIQDSAFKEFILVALDPLGDIDLVADFVSERLSTFPSSTIRIVLSLMETRIGSDYYQRMRYSPVVIKRIFDYVIENVEERNEFLMKGIEDSHVNLTSLRCWGSSSDIMNSLPFVDKVVTILRELVAIAYGLDMKNELHMRLVERFVR